MKRIYKNTGTCKRCVERLENTETEEDMANNLNDEESQHVDNDNGEGGFLEMSRYS
jgi:hypothetical protein